MGASVHSIKPPSVLQNFESSPEQLLFIYGGAHLGYSMERFEFGLSAQIGQFYGDQLRDQALSSLLAYMQLNKDID